MTKQEYTIYTLEDFAEEFLTKEEIRKLGETIERAHTWGDTALVAISGYELEKVLQRAGIPTCWSNSKLSAALEEHQNDLFELTGSTNTFWEQE